MSLDGGVKKWEGYRVLVFQYRDALSLAEKIMMSFVFAVLTGLAAQVRFILPVTPIPFTGQVFAVLLSAVVLGRFYGGLSQIFYVGLGMIGVPWFSGGLAGSLLSPTTGYLLGFIPAAFFIGWMTEKTPLARHFFSQVLILLLGVCIIYFFGSIYVMILTHSGVMKAFTIAVYPFIIFDIFKALSVSLITIAILPKTRY
ncbi:MAG: biotin transporter BioY [Candidatus Aureabacteria bacterium]|nr:biotin transporter BioY [Candidatus Auribacterota bacterium]